MPLQALQHQVAELQASAASLASINASLLHGLQVTQTQITAMQVRLTALETRGSSSGGVPDLEKYVSIDPNPIHGLSGPHIIFKAVNVHIQSGSGATDDHTSSGAALTGLGNLIIGYNEADATTGARTGSHNLVSGDYNSYTSFGGVTFGLRNNVSGRYATILGGDRNSSTGATATVHGGSQNTASGFGSTVLGGVRNNAPGQFMISPTIQNP
jgi:hypothetical protein